MLKTFFRVVMPALLLLLWVHHTSFAQDETPIPDMCEDARYLMARDSTPYDFTGVGGVLAPNVPNDVPFNRDIYAQFYAFRVERPLDRFQNRINANVALTFENVANSLQLEFALFRGMQQISPYEAITNKGYTFSLSSDGVYTVAVRRVHVRDVEVEGLVTLTANYPGDTEINPPNLPDASTRLLLVERPIFRNGLVTIPMPNAEVRLHTGSAIGTASLDGRGTQIRFEPGAVTVGTWAQKLALLGGDLAASGQTSGGESRIFYLENFGYRRELGEENLNIEDSNGNIITTDWQNLKGLWMFNDCIGVELLDGRTFTAPTQPQARQISFTGGLDNFAVRMNSLNAVGNLVPYALNWEWNGVAEESEVTLANGVLSIPLIGERLLELQSTNLTVDRRAAEAITPTTLLDVSLNDRGTTLTLDWTNFNRVALVGENVTLEFTDARTEVAPSLTRTAVNLSRIDAQNDVFQIIYQDREQGSVTIPGEQRLLLSADEGYIEIITPEGFPTFDSTALPDQPGYEPRALNNLGGECYPVNTTLSEVNCAPNGEVNPANGNLWYGVTDLRAFGGYGLDLTLTRSYNSRTSNVDGPFGFGWSTEYLLDYNVPFNEAQGSRPVTPETVASYRVGLDITYAPRGIVTFTTPSGSRHVFTTEATTYSGGELRALTMPGWTLSRDNLRDNWRLRQTDGFEYEFDRAGRVVAYGYPQVSRMVTIRYPRGSINGIVGEEPPAIAISDDFNARELELYYNNAYRIERSVLRDNTRSTAFETCELVENCFETRYQYDTNGLLVGVTYAGGVEATYEYDEERRLIAHNDPRAPIAPQMRYGYEDGNLVLINLVNGEETLLWRDISPPRIVDETRLVTVTDHLGRRRTYTYALDAGVNLRAVGDGFTLLSVTSPFSSVTEAGSDALTQNYTWDEGLLTQIGARVLQERTGRNSINFRYNADGTVGRISGGFLDFELLIDPTTGEATSVRFADDTALTYAYGSDNRPRTLTDRLGTTYELQWNEAGQLTSRVRAFDNKTWTYSQNSLGLFTTVTTGAHSIDYIWDGIGRLVGVNDPLLGEYVIEYQTCDSSTCGAGYTQIIVTDPLNVKTVSLVDEQGRLIETRQEENGSTPLRHRRYSYDVLDRLTAETTVVEVTERGEQLETTQYIYAPLQQLEGGEFIYGYSITRQDAFGRREIYVYDAFDRIRQAEDVLGRVTRYDYSSNGNVFANGFQITGTELRGTQVIATTTYIFDLAGQLRQVTRSTGSSSPKQITWNLITEGDPVKPRFLEAVGADIVALTWGEYAGMFPNDVQLRPVTLPLESGAPQPTLRYTTTYDELGRVSGTTDGGGTGTQRIYCLLPDGSSEERVSPTPITCEDNNAAERIVYDVHGRVLRQTGAFGTEVYAYSRDQERQEWVVEVAFSETEGWELRYNAAGDLTYWEDESGVVRRYTHDGAGRVVRVETDNTPEASFTFDYNAAGLVTRQVDDLGRGFIYQYDNRGLTLVRQDILTADATTFAYGPFGEITTVISPLGNTTSLQYEDPNNPTRITGITDPTGVLETFAWDEDANTLTYFDARGGRTVYTFDALGELWQIQDAAGEFHELHYDSAGRLSEVLTAQRRGVTGRGNAAQTLTLTRTEESTVTISELSQSDWRWTFGFNRGGTLTSLIDPAGFPITFSYDAMGRIEEGVVEGNPTNEDGAVRWEIERQDDSLQLLFTNNAEDTVTERYTFDNLYRLTGVADEENVGRFYNYATDERGNTTFTTRYNGAAERTYVFSPGDDSAQPRTVTVTAPGQTATYVYNAEGLIEEFRRDICIAEDVNSCVPGEGTVWTTSVRFRYDAQGRPVAVVDAEQNVETFAYDDLGNLVAYQTANGKTFNYNYDSLNRLLAVISPTGIKILLRYDALNNVTGVCRTRADAPNDFSVCEQNNRVMETFTYDSLGRLIAQTFPNETATGSTTITQRYAGGRLTEWGIPGATVQRVYEPNALALLNQVILEERVYNFDYDAKLRPLEAGDRDFTYDAYGRVDSLTHNTHRFDVEYAEEDRGYRLVDTESGEYVGYGLDERGFLSALDYGLISAPNAIPLLNIQYRLNPRQPTILSVVMTSDDQERTLDLQLNRLGETRNLVANFGEQRLLVDYITDPVGLVTRQRIDGSPPELFAEGAGGYVVIPGYDDDNRPTTLRVTDKSGGRLLYVLGFRYNESGQRIEENRSYADNTQMNIDYEYGTPNQLTRRIVEIVPPLTAQSLPTAAAVMVGLPLLFLTWKRRWRFIVHMETPLRVYFLVVVMVFGGVHVFSQVEAQQRTQVFTFDYLYDSAGNIREVVDADTETSCRTYFYDDANRLVAVEFNNDFTRLFEVNLYNQPVRIEETALQYAGEQPFGLNTGEGELYYGREASRPPFWIAGENGVIWQMPNGRDRVLSVVDNGEVEPIRLLDPLGRNVALTMPFNPAADDFDPCVLNDDVGGTQNLLPQDEFSQMIYAEGLYFNRDGRTYDPVIGRFLQRDPQGPDVLGIMYDLGQPQPVPAQRRAASTKAIGLTTYRDAVALTQSALDSSRVAQLYYPQLRRTSDWTEALVAPSDAARQLADLLSLPTRLQNSYNLPGAQIDPTNGAIVLDTGSAPGQGGLLNRELMPQTNVLNGYNTLSILRDLTGYLNVPYLLPPTSYRSRQWVPDSYAELSDLWENPAPSLGIEFTPGIVLQWLPRPLQRPEAALDTLLLAERLTTLPQITGRDWFEGKLNAALPQLPELPPDDPQRWRERWFTTDTLGLQRVLTERLEVPSTPYLPVYGIAYNEDWVFNR
jgi:YD repeat-containing protein